MIPLRTSEKQSFPDVPSEIKKGHQEGKGSTTDDSCFLNNYFNISLLACEANIDIQTVFDYHKDVNYMYHYLSKREDECAQTMKQVFKESLETSGGSSEHMKSVAHADTSKRECPLREAVYQVVREFLSSKSLPRRAIRKQ